MSEVSSSPVFTSTRESPFDATATTNRGTVSTPGIGAHPVPTNARRGTTFEPPGGLRALHHEGPVGREAWELNNFARTGGLFQSYATVYKAYDARENFEAENYDEDLMFPLLPDYNNPIEKPYDETGETDLDVKFTEDRVLVPPFMKLKAWGQEGLPKNGLRGHAILENKTGLNLTFFIKASSPILHVKETVDWLLPNETFKIHMKTLASYEEIANEFILVYTYPIYFREQLDMIKLRDFWNALGSDLNPLEHVECHRISKLLLSPQLQGDYSILDFVGVTSQGWFPGRPLVHLVPAIDIHEYPGYARFWTPKEKDMTVAIACHLREKKRATRRELYKEANTRRKWNKVLSTFFLLILASAMLVSLGLDDFAWPTVETEVHENIVVVLPVPSTVSIFTPPNPQIEKIPEPESGWGTIFTPSPPEIIEKIPNPPQKPLPQTSESGWGIEAFEKANWHVFLITRGIWTKFVDLMDRV